MLVTFSCKVYEDILMFGDIARKLLSLMGYGDTIPGAISAEDIPQALLNLEKGLKRAPHSAKKAGEDEEQEPDVSLMHRAIPLVEMLKAAQKNKCHVMWE